MSETTEPTKVKPASLEGASLTSGPTDKPSGSACTIDIKEFHLGVWHIKVALPRGRFAVKHYIDTIRSSLPFVQRLTMDIWALAPSLLILYLVCQFWTGVEEALLLQLSGTLLRKVCEYKLQFYLF